MPAGRPLKFKNPAEMQEKIDKYFAECKADERPLTITGLAVALDTTRELLVEYEKYDSRKEFNDTIKRAKQRIQSYAEESLWRNNQVAGVIFSLKNNYGWKDKQEIEHTGDITITLDGDLDKWSK